MLGFSGLKAEYSLKYSTNFVTFIFFFNIDFWVIFFSGTHRKTSQQRSLHVLPSAVGKPFALWVNRDTMRRFMSFNFDPGVRGENMISKLLSLCSGYSTEKKRKDIRESYNRL